MKSYAYDLLVNGERIDGRKLEDYREIEIEPGIIKNAEGSALVKIGNTKIISGVKFGTCTPYPDTPEEGTLSVNAEFTPLASPDFEAGPPGEDATELARVVDRGIRESECIDFKKFCITPSEKAWSISVDIHVINHDGNLIDCAFLASVSALLNARVPKLKDEQIVRGDYKEDLKVLHKPIEVTVCKVGDKFLLDPNFEEESAVEAKLTVCFREDGNICALQKQGSKELGIDEIKKMVEIATEKSKELRRLLPKS